MSTAVLVLTLREAAVFSRQAATLGPHRTLLAPPGSALLGWAAADGRYASFADRAFDVFHSGKVRFGDAFPITEQGEVAVPAPGVLLAPKVGAEPFSNGRLNSEVVRVGPGAYNRNSSGQAEPIAGARGTTFLTASGGYISPRTEGYLRTAVERQRRQTSALYSFESLARADGLRFAAQIECSPEAEHVWDQVLDAFRVGPLRLGRSKNAEFGGYFDCRILKDLSLWPTDEVRLKGGHIVRVLGLSPLALSNRLGELSADQPQAFGLPADAILDPGESAITFRRFAPWNAALNGRDVERRVLDAGSVLAFRLNADCTAPRCGWAGLFNECGLGRYWLDPPLLVPDASGAPSICSSSNPSLALTAGPPEETVGAPDTPPSALVIWADRQARLADTGARDQALDQILGAMQATTKRGNAPGPSQWRGVSLAALRAKDRGELVTSLFGVAGATGQDSATGNKVWREGQPLLRDMFRSILEKEKFKELPFPHLVWVVDQLARRMATAGGGR